MSLTLLDAAFAKSPRHVSPFVVLGDPTPDVSVALAVAAIDAGATMLELGIPYSDPCADGPAVQDACKRAFGAGVTVAVAIDVLAEIHAQRPDVPKNLLVYGNLVHAAGADGFCARVAAAGASSLLVPDIPLDEGAELGAACADHGLGHVQLVAPKTPPERLAQLDAAATGFLYLAAYQGVTGKAVDADSARSDLVRDVASAVGRPVCLGFGLSKPVHLVNAFEAGAQLCVVGSHLCRAIGAAWRRGVATAEVIAHFLDAFGPLAGVVQDPPVPTGD